MKKSGRPVAVRFMLVQPEEAARTWTDPELIKVLGEAIRIWAETVDGELSPHSLYITISRSEPAPD